MKKEAEANAEADKAAKESIEKVNQGDTLVFTTEKQLKEYGDKLPEDKKAAIEDAKEALKKAVEAKDIAGIDSTMEALNKAWEAASQDLYNAQQQAEAANGESADAGNAGGTDASSEADNVEDVDFEEVK